MEIDALLGRSRRFRLIHHLGADRWEAVFLAEQIAVGNRPVALKILNCKPLDNPEFLKNGPIVGLPLRACLQTLRF